MVSNKSEWNHLLEMSTWSVSIDVRFPLAQFLGSLTIMAAQFGEQRNHPRVDAGHQPITFPSLVVTHPQAAGATGETGYIHAR